MTQIKRSSVSDRGAGFLKGGFSRYRDVQPLGFKRMTQHTAESYRQTLRPNARLSRLLRLARMVRQERPA